MCVLCVKPWNFCSAMIRKNRDINVSEKVNEMR